MDLSELMGRVERHDAVDVAPDGDRLVDLRLPDDWSVGMRLHRTGTHRQWSVREVLVRCSPSAESIDGQGVRDLPLGALIAQARRLASRSATEPRPSSTTSLERLLARRGGRLGRDDEALAAVALAYVLLVEAGERRPSLELAARHGGSVGTWTNRVSHARRRGFLSPVERGAAGGRLTDVGRQALGLDPDLPS